MADINQPSLTINGKSYGPWTGIVVDRHIENMSSKLELTVAENWGDGLAPWQLKKFDAFTLSFGSDLVMTGYIDDYNPSFDENGHSVRISGRSKTAQLIDCSPDFPGGQFRGYALPAIARGVCQPFGITVVDQVGSTLTFPDATLQRTEKGFTFLQRLGRLSSVLLTDNPQGNLVLTQAGSTRASSSLAQGINIKRASARISGVKQFSQYIVLGQSAIGSALAGGLGQEDSGPITPVQTQLRAVATDTSVPLYRPHTLFAEAQLSQAGMQARAEWERNYGYGRTTQLDVTVVGFRQGDGSLWRINQIVGVDAQFLEVNQDLLIIGVKHVMDPSQGIYTVLTLAPIEGYTPMAGQVKIHTAKGKKGSIFNAGGWAQG
jgi:prophage tail gpP-like protein